MKFWHKFYCDSEETYPDTEDLELLFVRYTDGSFGTEVWDCRTHEFGQIRGNTFKANREPWDITHWAEIPCDYLKPHKKQYK